jgi:deazaflavin-dependent oxidoreductase (nitroreductase family)
MSHAESHFIAPGPVARAVNRWFGFLAGLGLGPSYSWLLMTRGRKTGKTFSTPVNVLPYQGKRYLVGTRGHTQWSRNALAAGVVLLKRGQTCRELCLRALPEAEKPEILRAYLGRYGWMVSRFFPVAANSPLSAYAAIGSRYPVFELVEER